MTVARRRKAITRKQKPAPAEAQRIENKNSKNQARKSNLTQ